MTKTQHSRIYLQNEVIDFDAQNGYQAENIQQLFDDISSKDEPVVVLFKNAHLLTTKAFGLLYDYLKHRNASDLPKTKNVFVLVSSDKSKIFPPLLEFVQEE